MVARGVMAMRVTILTCGVIGVMLIPDASGMVQCLYSANKPEIGACDVYINT